MSIYILMLKIVEIGWKIANPVSDALSVRQIKSGNAMNYVKLKEQFI